MKILFLSIMIVPFFSMFEIVEKYDGKSREELKEYSGELGIDTTKIFMKGLKFEKSDGTEFEFAEFANKVILIDFWATWCSPCRKQHPYVEDLYKKINNPDFELVTISIDRKKEDWKKFFEEHNWEGTNLYVGWDNQNPLFKMIYEPIGKRNGELLYKVSVPQYYLIDKNIEIVEIDDIESKEINEMINQMLIE